MEYTTRPSLRVTMVVGVLVFGAATATATWLGRTSTTRSDQVIWAVMAGIFGLATALYYVAARRQHRPNVLLLDTGVQLADGELLAWRDIAALRPNGNRQAVEVVDANGLVRARFSYALRGCSALVTTLAHRIGATRPQPALPARVELHSAISPVAAVALATLLAIPCAVLAAAHQPLGWFGLITIAAGVGLGLAYAPRAIVISPDEITVERRWGTQHIAASQLASVRFALTYAGKGSHRLDLALRRSKGWPVNIPMKKQDVAEIWAAIEQASLDRDPSFNASSAAA